MSKTSSPTRAHERAAASSQPGHSGVRRPRRASAAVLALLAVALLTLLVTATYGVTSEYGSAPGDLHPVDGVVVLLPTGLAVLLLLGTRSLLGVRGPPRPRWP